MIIHAYLPEIALDVGEENMVKLSSATQVIFLGSAGLFIVIIGGVSVCLDLDAISTGRLSQLMSSILVSIISFSGWKKLPSVGPKEQLEPGQVLLLAGFSRTIETFKMLGAKYVGVFYYFFGVMFTAGVWHIFPSIMLTGKISFSKLLKFLQKHPVQQVINTSFLQFF